MGRSTWRKLRHAVEIILALLGVMAVLIGLLIDDQNARGILFNVGTGAFVGAVATLVYRFSGTDDVTLIQAGDQFRQLVYDRGLEAIHLGFDRDGLARRFEHAQRIDLLANTGCTILTALDSVLAEAVLRNGCQIRILLSDETGPLWKIDEVLAGASPTHNIPADIVSTRRRIEGVADEVTPRIRQLRNRAGRRGSIEVRAYRCMPTTSIVLVDEDWARVVPYLPYDESAGVPGFDVVNARDHSLFDIYRRAFDVAWKHSTAISLYKFNGLSTRKSPTATLATPAHNPADSPPTSPDHAPQSATALMPTQPTPAPPEIA